MAADDSFLGLSRGTQVAVIGVVGGGLLFLGLAGSSAVDPEYAPVAFGVGLVMVAYAAIVAARHWWHDRD